tara:strand:+ start:42 stop:437 length:396 start_codon:yes stop_codon:yes gene_type:complete
MAFKLGSEKRGALVRKKLGKGILGEANKDGSIYISDKIKPGSKKEQIVYNHEKQHQDDMDAGILDYGNNWVRYKNKTYHRKDGKIKYDGKWYEEGSMKFPWEKRAKRAEKGKEVKTITDGRAQSAAFQKNK